MKQKCLTANAELVETVVNLEAGNKKLIRQQRVELHGCVGARTSLEKGIKEARTNEVVANKKTEKSNNRITKLTHRLETETKNRKLAEGEMGRLVRGKGLLTKQGKAVAKVIREDADCAIKQSEQISATKVCYQQ